VLYFYIKKRLGKIKERKKGNTHITIFINVCVRRTKKKSKTIILYIVIIIIIIM
jgi:hypothetical protein